MAYGFATAFDLGGAALDEGGKILIQNMVSPEELIESPHTADRAQGPLEEQPVKTPEYADYPAAMSLKEFVHGRSF